MTRHIFAPDTGNATLVASFSGEQTHIAPDWEAERKMVEDSKREAEFRPLMAQRYGVCG